MYKGAGVVAVVLAGPKTHVQGVQGQVDAQRGRDLPAHDPAAEDIEDEGAVDPAGERPHIRNVGDPQPVRAVGGGGTVDQILPGVRGGPGNRRTRTLRARDPAQAKVFHQPRGGAASRRLAPGQGPQLTHRGNPKGRWHGPSGPPDRHQRLTTAPETHCYQED